MAGRFGGWRCCLARARHGRRAAIGLAQGHLSHRRERRRGRKSRRRGRRRAGADRRPHQSRHRLEPARSGIGGGRQRQGAGRSESQASPAGRRRVVLVRAGQSQWRGRVVGQAIDDSVLGYAGRRRSHRRPAATLFRRRSAAAENHHRRAAIRRLGMGGDDRARRGLDLGQDRDRSAGRSIAGAKQARHLAEQVGAAGASRLRSRCRTAAASPSRASRRSPALPGTRPATTRWINRRG